MARGSEAKAAICQSILEKFEGSFLYNDGKEIRIPAQENGEEVQIKVSLTCAKENVEPGQDNALPGISAQTNNINNEINFEDTPKTTVVEPTPEEKSNVQDLLRALGL
jgi:hypothetical protein